MEFPCIFNAALYQYRGASEGTDFNQIDVFVSL